MFNLELMNRLYESCLFTKKVSPNLCMCGLCKHHGTAFHVQRCSYIDYNTLSESDHSSRFLAKYTYNTSWSLLLNYAFMQSLMQTLADEVIVVCSVLRSILPENYSICWTFSTWQLHNIQLKLLIEGPWRMVFHWEWRIRIWSKECICPVREYTIQKWFHSGQKQRIRRCLNFALIATWPIVATGDNSW